MTSPDRPVTTALRQLPVVAAVWGIHGALLFWLFVTRVPDSVPGLHRFLLVMGLLMLVLFEIGLLTLANAAVEALTLRLRAKGWIDALKAGALAGLVGLLAASTLKFHATSVHLKQTDLWFARNSLAQILQEASVAEALALLSLPTATLVIGVLAFVGLRKSRLAEARVAGRGVAATALVSGLGFAAALWASPAVQIFARDFAPETHRISFGRSFEAARPASGAAAGAFGPPIGRYEAESLEQPHNVVLIMLESVPWSRTSFGGWRGGVTPNLERLAEDSILFSRPYTASTHSDYAQMAILSSLHPRKFDRHDYYTDLSYPRTLIWDVLKAAGYTTAMFSCQNEKWGNMIHFLNTPGLDVLRHSLHWPRARRRGRGSESKVYEETPVDEWIAWRRGRAREPYFTYLNFQSNHFPYEAPPEAPRPFTPYELDFPVSFLRYSREHVPTMLNRFDNALHYADAQLGRVVEELRANGELERTALIVVSDHGEAFYEHDEPTHGTALYEEQVRSFLMLRLPGEAARRIDQPVSLLDVPPTLLRHLGLPAHGNFQGRGDVLDPGYVADGRPFHFTIQGLTQEDGVLQDDWKYVVNWDRRERRLFDLSTDPEERTNLLEERPDRAEALDRELGDFLTRQLAYYEQRGWLAGRYPPEIAETGATGSR